MLAAPGKKLTAESEPAFLKSLRLVTPLKNNYTPRAFSHIFPFGGPLMVGLMQIMIYMLSVYLIFKGVEILQIALMSGRANRTLGVIIGILVLSTAVVAAGGFSLWADQVAASIGQGMNTLPNLQR